MTAFIPPNAPGMLFPPYRADQAGRRSTPYTDLITADNPKIWYRFNEASPATTILDSSGNGFNATEVAPGSTQYQQPGLITEAGQFSQGSIDNPDSNFDMQAPGGVPVDPNLITVEFWTAVNPLDFLNNFLLITTGVGDTINIACNDAAGAMFIVWGGVNVPAFVTTAGLFETSGHYYAFTFNGTDLLIYKDGVQVASQLGLANVQGNNLFEVQFGAGTALGEGGGNFGGFIDEMAIYAGVLTPARILTHYNAGIATITTSPTLPGNENQTRTGGIVTAPNAPPLRPQAPLSTVRETWPNGPPAAATRPSATVNPYTTQDQTNTFFRIISPRPGSGT